MDMTNLPKMVLALAWLIANNCSLRIGVNDLVISLGIGIPLMVK